MKESILEKLNKSPASTLEEVLRGKNGRETRPSVVKHMKEAFDSDPSGVAEAVEKALIDADFFAGAMAGKEILTLKQCVDLEAANPKLFSARNLLGNLHPNCDPKIVMYIEERCSAWQEKHKETRNTDSPTPSLSALCDLVNMGPHLWKARVGMKLLTEDHCIGLEHHSGKFFEASKLRPDHFIDRLSLIGYTQDGSIKPK